MCTSCTQRKKLHRCSTHQELKSNYGGRRSAFAVSHRFPADYPDTSAGRLHWDAVGADLGSQWQRSRPKHRGFKLPSHQPRPPAIPASGGKKTASGKAPSPESGVVPRASGGTELLPSFRPDFRFLAGVVDPQAATSAHRQDVPQSSPPAMEEKQPTHTAAALITAVVVNDAGDPTKCSVPNKAEPEQEGVGMPGGNLRVDNETVGDARQISANADPSGHCDDHISETAGTSYKDDEDAMHEADHEINVAASAPEGGLVVDREPFALARGFHYCQAFLPPEGKGIAPEAPPSPLSLAVPTMLSVKVSAGRASVQLLMSRYYLKIPVEPTATRVEEQGACYARQWPEAGMESCPARRGETKKKNDHHHHCIVYCSHDILCRDWLWITTRLPPCLGDAAVPRARVARVGYSSLFSGSRAISNR